jgi:class 3 adenylate cyclase
MAAQRALVERDWPEGLRVRVRMGLHTGEPTVGAGSYVGLDVHRAARICGAGHGGQILLSDATRRLVAGDVPRPIELRDLGRRRLKDLDHPEHLFQVLAPELPAEFPALRSARTPRRVSALSLSTTCARCHSASQPTFHGSALPKPLAA